MIKKVTKADIIKMTNTEGLICLGTGGDLEEWVEGINEMMVEENVTTNKKVFTDIYAFEDGETTNLLFLFPETKSEFNVSRLAMVRLQYDWMKWLSDYIGFESDYYEHEYEEEDIIPHFEPNHLFISGKRNGYSPEQCGRTLTVGELINILEDYDEDTLIYLSNDNGYTYGSITESDINCEEEY